MKLNEMKKKTCEKANHVKEWASDHKDVLIAGGVLGAAVVCGVYGVCTHKKHKVLEKHWADALNALDRKDTGFDYGPFKIMRFFEPNTEKFIGEIPCHVNAVNGFLALREES